MFNFSGWFSSSLLWFVSWVTVGLFAVCYLRCEFTLLLYVWVLIVGLIVVVGV